MVQNNISRGKSMKFTSDVDIDFADRTEILSKIQYVPASIIKDNTITKHNTGVYVTQIPVDPFTGQASLDYKTAELRGYIKLDFLNVNLYKNVKNETHLLELMNTEPPWSKLYDKSFCEQLIHIGNHYDSLIRMPEPIIEINQLAMFLAIIRPAKRHLLGNSWSEVANTIWDKSDDGGYSFKRSHAIAYAHLVVVNMNLLNYSSN